MEKERECAVGYKSLRRNEREGTEGPKWASKVLIWMAKDLVKKTIATRVRSKAIGRHLS